MPRSGTRGKRNLNRAPWKSSGTISIPSLKKGATLCAERFAGEWSFRWKLQRRGDWTRGLEPTLAMWEHVLDSLQRRYRRREGVSEADITQVERILAKVKAREALQRG